MTNLLSSCVSSGAFQIVLLQVFLLKTLIHQAVYQPTQNNPFFDNSFKTLMCSNNICFPCYFGSSADEWYASVAALILL